jgi:hypothetical protein
VICQSVEQTHCRPEHCDECPRPATYHLSNLLLCIRRAVRLVFGLVGRIASAEAQPFLPFPSQRADAKPDIAGYRRHQASAAQFVEQRLGVFQIGGVEALGEPVVDLGEHRAGLVATTSEIEQPSEAGGRTQF